MKKMKKLTSVLLALAMVMGMGVTALAETNYTITISNPASGDSYSAYKIFDVTYNTDVDGNTGENYSYTISTASDWLQDVMNYIGATITTDPTTGDVTITEPTGDVTNTDGNGLTLTKSADGSCYVVSVTTGAATDNFSAANFAQYLATKTAGKTADAEIKNYTTGNDAVLDVNAKGPGYYLVTCTNTVHDVTTALAELTTTNPTATIIDKNDIPFDKTVDEDAADGVEIGQIVNYTVTGIVPSTSGYDEFTYIVTDKLSEGLTFNGNSIKLTVNDVEISSDSDSYTTFSIFATKGNDGNYADYYLKKTVDSADQYYKWNNDTGWNDSAEGSAPQNLTLVGFEMRINMANLQDNIGNTIKITYSATVNDNAVAVVSENSATLEYSNDPGTTIQTTSEADVYSSKIVIDKYAKNTVNEADKSTKLAGAEFVLYKRGEETTTEPTSGDYDTVTENGTTSYYPRSYYKYTAASENTAAKVEWVGSKDQATVKTTDNNGAASFNGIQDGTYYLLETKAPDGYNLLKEPVTVTVNPYTTEDGVTTFDATKLTVNADVANSTGSILPSTGGMGTTIFYIVGGILVLAAAILLITRRCMGSEK